jgi:hypothetical protein
MFGSRAAWRDFPSGSGEAAYGPAPNHTEGREVSIVWQSRLRHSQMQISDSRQ